MLLYLVNPIAPEHAATAGEFWSVATRSTQTNGLGWSIERVRAAVEAIRERFPVLADPPEVLDLGLELVVTHGLKGKRIQDAHLVARMKANGVTRLLTFDAGDFPAEPGIDILTPDS